MDLIDDYKNYVCPDGARLAIVGDIEDKDVFAAVNAALGSWSNIPVPEVTFPPLTLLRAATSEYPINRDQTVLCFAGHSVARLDERYDALILFDQIFSGGVLGSMSSYLFQLREQTGLFYTIGGSLVANADEQPGLIYIRTIVSNDRLVEAEKLIENAIATATNIITTVDVEHARNALINSLVDNFESNDAMAQSFLFVDRFGLPSDYFDRRLMHLKSISLQKIKEAVESVLNLNHLIKLRIGRKVE
jgi:predicted Zn-dependent peptidase